jgi:hypothetical protein
MPTHQPLGYLIQHQIDSLSLWLLALQLIWTCQAALDGFAQP